MLLMSFSSWQRKAQIIQGDCVNIQQSRQSHGQGSRMKFAAETASYQQKFFEAVG
jgi:hypothetical protein